MRASFPGDAGAGAGNLPGAAALDPVHCLDRVGRGGAGAQGCGQSGKLALDHLRHKVEGGGSDSGPGLLSIGSPGGGGADNRRTAASAMVVTASSASTRAVRAARRFAV
jgi:hypothetical protein